MKKRVISVIVVFSVILAVIVGNQAKAGENGVWFVFTSFGQIKNVEIINETTGDKIILNSDELFDYETLDFVDRDTSVIKLTKNYMDGTVIKQTFNVEGADSLVGIYDDGTCGESWMEIDEKYVY